MKKNSWKTLSSKTVYTNPYMSIVENDVVRPNGYRAPYFVLKRPTFSVIVPVNENGHTYLVKQYRYPISRDSWEFPMGTVEGIDPIAVAKQELQEETGLTAASWQKIGEYAIAPGHNNQIANLYLATDLTVGKATPEQGELLTLKKVPMSQVAAQIADGTIIDGPTICAYHLYQAYLQKK